MTAELAKAPYRDPDRTVAEPATDLLGRMTLDEKIAQITGVWPALIVDGDSLSNVGDRAGEEVVQLHLHDLDASVTRPVKQLAGFKRVAPAAGQRAVLTFHVDLSQIAFHDDTMLFTIEPGPIEVMVGASSEDIRGRATVEVTGA